METDFFGIIVLCPWAIIYAFNRGCGSDCVYMRSDPNPIFEI